MQKQTGHCAFSNACCLPGELHTLEGTNRDYCPTHYVAMHIPAAADSGTEFARSSFTAPRSSRRQSNWATYVGVSEAY